MWRKLFGKSRPRSSSGLSRRELVTAATVVAATGAMSAAAAQTKPATAGSDHLRFHNPGSGPKSTGFTQAVEAIGPGRIIYVAGQQGLDASNKVVGAPGDFRAQAEQAFVNTRSRPLARDGSTSSSSTTTTSISRRTSRSFAIFAPSVSPTGLNRPARWCKSWRWCAKARSTRSRRWRSSRRNFLAVRSLPRRSQPVIASAAKQSRSIS